jgi:hypothetical protein
MLSWEEFEEKEVKPVKAKTQEKQAQPAPQQEAFLTGWKEQKKR